MRAMKREMMTVVLSIFLMITSCLAGTGSWTQRKVRATGYDVSSPRWNGDVSIWDCVWFGNYWQYDTNGDGVANQDDKKMPIKWRILSVDGDDAFLLADHNLDGKQYNETFTNVTWENCTLRSWLNGYSSSVNINRKDFTSDNFFNNAFNYNEQQAIRSTTLTNDDNPVYET